MQKIKNPTSEQIQDYITYLVEDVEDAAHKIKKGGWMNVSTTSHIESAFDVSRDRIHDEIDKWAKEH